MICYLCEREFRVDDVHDREGLFNIEGQTAEVCDDCIERSNRYGTAVVLREYTEAGQGWTWVK